MSRPQFILIPLILFFSGAAYGHPPDRGKGGEYDTTLLPCQQKAQKLLDEALTFMKRSYYRKQEVNWDQLAGAARERLLSFSNCDDAYSTITWCFHQLNDQHSFVMSPEKTARYTNDEQEQSRPTDLSQLIGEIKGEWLQDSIAYLTIPWVSSTDSLICERVADSIQSVIASLDTRHISRWIIDLRKNTGGNFWPMLAGIGPLLGDGVCGYFVSSSGQQIPIQYRNGSAFQGRHEICRVSGAGYHTRCSQKSIVVLTGRRTVSAGEIVALAFKGREQTRIFGEPTAGLTTANATYSLSDRSMLVLSVCQEADFTGRICQGSVVPDKMITPSTGVPQQEDTVKSSAVSWLMTR